MKVLLTLAVLFASCSAFPEAGPWKTLSINETTSNVHNYVFTAEEVCQVLFFRKAVTSCPSQCVEGLAGWHWRASLATVLSGSTLAGNATVLCKGLGTFSCKGPQSTILGEPVDFCRRL